MTLALKLLVSGLALGAVYSLIAMGYSTVYKASGLMNFVQGDVLTLGAFLGLTFHKILGLPYWLSLILTVVCAMAFGMLIEKGIIRRLLNRNLNAIYIILATIAVSYIIQNGSFLIWGGVTEYFPSMFDKATIDLFGIKVQPEAILCFTVALFTMLLMHLFMNMTKLGTAMRAASMDARAAESCGINVSLTTGLTWGIATAIASVAGMIVGPMYGVYVSLGSALGGKAFAGAVMGGFGNMYGAMVGGLLLGLLETFISGFVSSTYKNLIAYLLLLVFLFIKPTGLFNEKEIQDI